MVEIVFQYDTGVYTSSVSVSSMSICFVNEVQNSLCKYSLTFFSAMVQSAYNVGAASGVSL